jgi:hypothetical protein
MYDIASSSKQTNIHVITYTSLSRFESIIGNYLCEVDMFLTATVHQQLRLTRLKRREITLQLFGTKCETHTRRKYSNPNIKLIHVGSTLTKHSRN